MIDIKRHSCFQLDCLVLTDLRDDCVNYLSKLEINHTSKMSPTKDDETLSEFLRNLKIKRADDAAQVQIFWSSIDCNDDPNIEFYCNGRLPVFNEWNSTNAKRVSVSTWIQYLPTAKSALLIDSFFKKSGLPVVLFW